MFTKPLTYIITPKSLTEAYAQLNTASSGIDEVTFSAFEAAFRENIEALVQSVLEGTYAPEPLKKIAIDKPDSDEKRPIGISAVKDKLIQRVLYDHLAPYYDKRFSDASYAYRPGKSTLKAINRVTQYLDAKNLIVLKTDIDSFFDTIDHDILLALLDKEIRDKQIIRLISLLIQIGGFQAQEYEAHLHGVYQGDILSPLLSNIYLNEMDQYLENKGVKFVRYADDFALFFPKKNDAYPALKRLKKFLKTLKLSLEYDKTKIVHVSDGFIFLRIEFRGMTRNVSRKRLEKSLQGLRSLSRDKAGFLTFVERINSYLRGIQNYYLKIITPRSEQHRLIEEALIETLVHKVYRAKTTKTITTKKEFKILLATIKLEILFESETKKNLIKHIVALSYEKYLAEKSYKDTTPKIKRQKNKYARKFANDTTLHIAQPGLMLGISKNKFTLKKYGKVQKTFPVNKIERIIFEGKGYSLSTNVIEKCAHESITIDFISRDASPYASLITYKSSTTQTIHKQAMLPGTPTQLALAKAFLKGKAKNQLNYLKYLNRYHQRLDRQIVTIEQTMVRFKQAKTIDELMGYEGSISASYWEGLRQVLKVPFEKRITRGARDIVNSSLNYGYAILYGRVQHALVYAGLSLNVSFLHAIDGDKPTLTFDMIEEFRTFMVDRVIISMLNKGEPISLDSSGLLTQKSRQLIAQNIKEKLGSYTQWKKQSRKCDNIIQTQCYNLAKVVNGEAPKYKPFIGKF